MSDGGGGPGVKDWNKGNYVVCLNGFGFYAFGLWPRVRYVVVVVVKEGGGI